MIYAIADLHLSLDSDGRLAKPMDVFGGRWENHHEKISENWKKIVSDEDTVILTGDFSWAMRSFENDFKFLTALPGKKILVRGNHDYWWNATTRLNELDENVFFLQNNFCRIEGFHICGTRGWLCPEDSGFEPSDQKIYNREVTRFKNSLDMAMGDGAKDIIACLHYPPGIGNKKSGFVSLIENYPVRKVVFGHLHGDDAKHYPLKSTDKTEFYLTSADFLNFCPVKIN